MCRLRASSCTRRAGHEIVEAVGAVFAMVIGGCDSRIVAVPGALAPGYKKGTGPALPEGSETGPVRQVPSRTKGSGSALMCDQSLRQGQAGCRHRRFRR